MGSTLALADTSGAVATSYAYTPYGATTTSGAASTNAVQYTGRENDANGLYYYRARYYNPTTGRFISEDPLGLAAGINIYAYAADDPVDLNDPSGMFVNLAAGCVAGVVMSVAVDLVTAIGNWLSPNLSVGGVPLAKRKITVGGMLVDAAIGCALGAFTMGMGELFYLARYGGEGAWAFVDEAMSDRAAAYQLRITGAQPGSVYELNGVKFDGYSGGVLQDAKGPGYSSFVKNGRFVGWFNGADSMVTQARSQLAAAGGRPITWYVAESDTAAAIRTLFEQNGISGINVQFTP